ncbi:diguanylate cyclase, partial [Chloroflexota bacterium]
MYLQREKKSLTSDNMVALTEFHSLRQEEKEQTAFEKIEVFVPMIIRERQIGILALDKKRLGRYTLEDLSLLEEVTRHVSVSTEKEYLSEQLMEREAELAVINRSSAIITSSLDIQRIYDSFIKELRKIVDLRWTSVVLLEGEELYFLALSSEIGSAWRVGERIPANDTSVHYAIKSKKAIMESDLSHNNQSSMRRYLFEHGIRSIIYLPLITGNNIIGCLIIASRQSSVYTVKDIKLLEELSALIAMPIENSMLYAEAEQLARSDSLTGLLNRRSLDEIIASEIGRHSRYGGTFSVMLMDLDSFKSYNDSYGHLAGDKFLRKVGIIMKTSIRSADQAFRFGGDEFALLFPHTDITDAVKVAERIRTRIAAVADSSDSSCRASIGIASWPTGGIEVNDIISSADSSLLQAKRRGGNRVHIHSNNDPSGQTDAELIEIGEYGRLLSTIYSLATKVDAREHYSHSHSKKVNDYAIILAKALNLEPLEINRISTCALLHDIGKIGISGEILNKKGKLTAEECDIIKRHPQTVAAIVSHTRQLAPCTSKILYHHERYDGMGYPKRLGGEIPQEA